VPIVLKSGSLKLPEPSGPVQTCNGIALPLPFCVQILATFFQIQLHVQKNIGGKYKVAFDVTDNIEMECCVFLRCFMKKGIKRASLTANSLPLTL
jgi:hypothetical protein